MSVLPSKKGRDAFDEARPEPLNGRTEQEPGELSRSGTHTQPSTISMPRTQFGAKVVQFAVKPVIDYDVRNPVISKKVLAAMAGDPDPTTTLADIRKLLVGPTHKLHDAMFEEVITILEESDREVQDALQSLESDYITSFPMSPMNLLPLPWKARIKTAFKLSFCKRKSSSRQSPSRIWCPRCFSRSMRKSKDWRHRLTRKLKASRKESKLICAKPPRTRSGTPGSWKRKCLAISREAADHLENRVTTLENNAGSAQDNLREVFADGLASMA